MLWLSRTKLRWRALFRKETLDEELSQELEFHLAAQKAEYMASGADEAEADAAAHRVFGPVAVVEEECRDKRRTRWLEDFLQDTRYALRSFWNARAFSIVTVVTLALGIGANTAFFSTTYGILFRPLPYPAPERLVDMKDGIGAVGPVTAMRDLSKAADYAGYLPDHDLNFQSGGEASKVRAATVTWNLARVLGVSPARGRWFDRSEERPGRNRVAVLSERAWRERFSADPDILGRSIILNEEPFEIKGVMPSGFAFPSPDTELWIPIHIDPRDVGYMWGGYNLLPIARLRNGMTLAAAQAELRSAIDRIRAMFPWRMPDAWGAGARVVLRSDSVVKDVRPKLFALTTAALLLLLIACGNVSNLLLARAVRREREIAMREALGAGRGRLLRQMLTENFVLVIAGGLAGLLTATAILRGLPALLPKDTPRLNEVSMDGTLVLAAGASILLTIALFSAVPALRLWRARRESLVGRAVTASKRNSRISLALIGVELSLATTLLIGAGLMGRTLWKLASVDSGIHSAGVVTARLAAGPSRCANRDRCLALLQDLNKALVEVPGVRSVSWSNLAPLDKEFSATAVAIEDHPKAVSAPADVFWQTAATPGYFRALGIPLRAGRLFTEADRAGVVPVMVISESTARHYWPNQSAIGKRVRPMSDRDWITVVGVVADVAQYSLTGFPSWIDGAQYVPLAQFLPRDQGSVELTAFLECSQPQRAAPLIGAVRQHYPDLVLSRVSSLERIRSESTADQRSTAWLLAFLAGLGLVLGVAGVYGVISQRAAQRTREIGIRMALGASAPRVMRMVLQETLLVALAGTAVGVAAALGLSRSLRLLLFGVTTHDTATLAICPAVLLVAALLAAAVPGLRASRTDPATTLREE